MRSKILGDSERSWILAHNPNKQNIKKKRLSPKRSPISEESDGGYSSHDTSQEESMTSFCYRNYLGDWKTWVQTNWYLFHLIISGYGYPVIVSKGSSVLLSQHTALPSYDGMRKGTAIWFKSSLKFCTYILTWNIAYSIILSFRIAYCVILGN